MIGTDVVQRAIMVLLFVLGGCQPSVEPELVTPQCNSFDGRGWVECID